MAYFCQAEEGVRETKTSSTFAEWSCTRVITYREVRRNQTRETSEAVRNRTTSRGPRNHKNGVGSYETNFRCAKKNLICFAEDCGQRSKWSEPHFLTYKFLLTESVANVIIRKLYVTLLFPRHAQPSLLPVKEAVSVLSLHKVSQPSNTVNSKLLGRNPSLYLVL